MPDYSVGSAYLSIVPSLLGDRSAIQSQLDELTAGTDATVKVIPEVDQTKLADIETALEQIPDPTVQIDLEDTDANAKLTELRAKLDELKDKRIGVDIDAAAASAELASIQAELDKIAAEHPDVQVRADVAAASSSLAAVQAECDRIAAEHPSVKVDADTASADTKLAAADAEVSHLDGRKANVNVSDNGSSDATKTKISNLTAAIVGLGPALIPIGAVAVGALGAIGTGALAGIAGLGTLKLAFSGVGTALSDMSKAQDGDSQAAQKLQQDLAKLPQPAQDFVKQLQTMTPELTTLRTTAAAGLFPGVDTGLQSLNSLFPTLNGIVATTSQAMGNLARDAGAALKDPFWQNFFNYIKATAGPAITALGTTFGNVFKGIAGLIQGAAPLWQGLQTGIQNVSKAFADFGSSAAAGTNSGFNAVMKYIQDNVPKVMQLVKDLGPAVSNLIKAFAPFGGITLTALDQFAKLIAATPTPVLTAIAGAIEAIVLGLKGFSLVTSAVKGVSDGLTAIGKAASGVSTAVKAVKDFELGAKLASAAAKVWTGIQAALDVALDANPIGLIVIAIAALVAGIIYAYTHFQSFRDIVNNVWDNIKTGAQQIGAFFSGPFLNFFKAIPGVWNSIWSSVGQFFTTQWNQIKSTATTVWNAITTAFSSAWNAVSSVWTAVWNAVSTFFTTIWNTIKSTATTVWNAITTAFSTAWNAVTTVWNTVWTAVSTFFTTTWNAISSTAQSVWNTISSFFTSAWNTLSTAWTTFWTGVSTEFTTIWNTISSDAQSVWNTISSFFTSAWATFTSAWTTFWNGVSTEFTTIWNTIQSAANTAWNALSSFFTSAWATFTSAWTTFWQGVQTAFTTAWSAIQSAAQTAWNAVSSFFTSAWNTFKSDWTSTWDAVKTTFTDAWNSIKSTAQTIWNDIETLVKNGVNNVIQSINGLISGANSALGGVGLSIPTIPTLAAGGVVPMAQGGEVPMYASGTTRIGGGFVTNTPTAIVGEGGPHPEYVIPTDPKFRGRATALYAALGSAIGAPAVMGAMSSMLAASTPAASLGAINPMTAAIGASSAATGRAYASGGMVGLPVTTFDVPVGSTGYLPEGLSIANNGTGAPEPLMRLGSGGAAKAGGAPSLTQHIYPAAQMNEASLAAMVARHQQFQDRVISA